MEPRVRIRKEGTTKMSKHSMICAGIDTSKRKLDVAVDGSSKQLQVGNDGAGHRTLSAWLRQRRVKRVGIEASGGYEQEVVMQLRHDGFTVVVFQPAQVRAYAKFHLQRAKNDKLDAALIATCTTAAKKIHPAPDSRLAAFAQRLTAIDQLKDQVVRLKTYHESCRDPQLQRFWSEEIARLEGLSSQQLKQLIASIREHRDLTERLALITSVDSIGLPTAVAILVRLPEIGRISREQATALAGLAPYDDDTGEQAGVRHIDGGRARLRKALFNATLSGAFRWNRQLMAINRRMTAAGKPHKVMRIACARKLLIFANAVVARGTPWTERPIAA